MAFNGPALKTPLTLKPSELAILPQQTLTVTLDGKQVTEKGPTMQSLLTYASLQFNAQCKNDELRVLGNDSGARDLMHVTTITVGRADPQLPAAGCATSGAVSPVPWGGSVVVNGAVESPSTLTWSQLQALPQSSATVSFLQGRRRSRTANRARPWRPCWRR